MSSYEHMLGVQKSSCATQISVEHESFFIMFDHFFRNSSETNHPWVLIFGSLQTPINVISTDTLCRIIIGFSTVTGI